MPAVDLSTGRIEYDVVGEGEPIVLTPGGRYPRTVPGLRPLAEALAAGGMRVLLWDRRNTGGSDVGFEGESESDMWADDLAELLQALGMAPCVIAGGSAGSRVSMLTVIRHPEVATRLAMWWISGGVYGSMGLAGAYVMPFISIARKRGMEAVADMPQWGETVAANPRNRERIASMDVEEFVSIMKRWLNAFVPTPGQPIPGVTAEQIASIRVPTLIFRGGRQDDYHPEQTSREVHALIQGSQLVDPPWGEDEWDRVSKLRDQGKGGIFDPWVRLAPQLLDFAKAPAHA